MITMNVSGNITADATVKAINGSDSQVVNFTIASNSKYKTKTGEQKEEVTFINCALWDKPEVAQYLNKGRAINAVGFMKTRIYESKDGVSHSAINLRVTLFQLFGKNLKSNTATQEQRSNADIPPTEEFTQTPEGDDILPF